MNYKIAVVFLSLLFSNCQSNGQQKSKTKPKPVNSQPALSGYSEIIQTVPEQTFDGLAPGAIAPNAAQVDADWIESIVDGVCIIRKGNLYAIVDLHGNFIRHWDDARYNNCAPFSTLIGVNKPSGSGFINIKGETVIPFVYGAVFSFTAQHVSGVRLKGTPSQMQIDNKGNIITKYDTRRYIYPYERNEYDRPQSGLINFYQPNVGNGFMNREGKVVIPPQRYINAPFTDGLTVVGSIDQFGKPKWGYMNEAGKMAIPYTFTNQPGYFHDGFALVFPTTRTTFNFAYIDKTGNVRFTVGNGQEFQPYHTNNTATGFFINGYALWNYGDYSYNFRFLDTLGNMHNPTEIVRKPELEYQGIVGIDDYTDQGIFVYNSRAGNTSNTHGLVNLKGEYLFPPVFYKLTPDYYSPYAVAEKEILGANNSTIHLQGVVNRQGVFVLVLKQKSLF